jgi:hypothetical protein
MVDPQSKNITAGGRAIIILLCAVIIVLISGCSGGPNSAAPSPAQSSSSAADGQSPSQTLPSSPVSQSPLQTPSGTGSATPGVQTPSNVIQAAFPLRDVKGYSGTLHLNSYMPVISLGDPGYLQVSNLPLQELDVSDETVGGRTAYLTPVVGNLSVDVFVSWRLTGALAADAARAIQGQGCNCDTSQTFLVSQGNARLGEMESHASIAVTPDQPAIFVTQMNCLACPTSAALTDASGNTDTAQRAQAQFPEAHGALLQQLLSSKPDFLWVAYGFVGGMKFGNGDTAMVGLPCTLSGNRYVYGSMNIKTGELLRWPKSHQVPGQICYSQGASAPPAG